MAVSIPALSRDFSERRDWLHSRDWDLTFISLSVILVTVPYLAYIGLLELCCFGAIRPEFAHYRRPA